MASDKKIENAQRLRYIRLLERFFNSIISYLSKSEEPTKEQYVKRVANNSKYLDRMEAIPLYKSELTDLEALVKKMKTLAASDKSIEEISEDILYSANKLEQSNNNRRYKKDKHKNEQFKDWE
jgi:regulator of PEP synthase PpsR (kinase-PPPase family)